MDLTENNCAGNQEKCPETVPEEQTGMTKEEQEWGLKKEPRPPLPRYVFGVIAALILIIFLGGSYMTEAFRAGLESIEKVQIESGLSIGLSRRQLMRYVIFPQAFRIALPAIGANFIFLLKETSVVSAISVAELLYTTNSLIAIYYKTYEMLFLLVISYFILIGPLSFILYLTERRMKYD